MKNLFYLCLLLVGFCGVTSCETVHWNDEEDDLLDETTFILCNNLWEDFFIADDGADCRQTFQFRPNGEGVEKREYMYNGIPDGYKTFTFYWRWNNKYDDSIIMDYGSGDISYFDDIRVTNTILAGFLDGEKVAFKAYHLRSSAEQYTKVRHLRVR